MFKIMIRNNNNNYLSKKILNKLQKKNVKRLFKFFNNLEISPLKMKNC